MFVKVDFELSLVLHTYTVTGKLIPIYAEARFLANLIMPSYLFYVTGSLVWSSIPSRPQAFSQTTSLSNPRLCYVMNK
jgi:hypothetical protein